jgi:hypothetical protein
MGTSTRGEGKPSGGGHPQTAISEVGNAHSRGAQEQSMRSAKDK